MKSVLEKIKEETPIPIWLIGLFVLLFLLRIPSFFEPYWYGDEAIYLTVGEGVRQGLLLYKDLYDNKPPLIYLLGAIAGNVFWFKVILAFWSLATIYLFWKLGQLLWPKNEKIVRVSTIIFAILTTIPLLEGNIANAEIFMILPTIAAFVILLSGKLTLARVFIAGFVAGLGGLFKVPSIIDGGVPIIFWLGAVLIKRLDLGQFLKQSSTFIAGLAFPSLFPILFFAIIANLGDYLAATFVQTVGYLSTWQARSGDFFTRNGPLFIRGAVTLVLIGTLLLLKMRKKISPSFLFVASWFFLSLFAALLSERPYPHYLIQVAPSFSLFLGIAFADRSKEQFYPYPLFAMLGAALIFYKFTYYGVFPYYENFLAWAGGARNERAYFAHFDERTPRNYEIARYISERAMPEDRLFVWGDDPELYSLTKLTPATRYVVAYHIRDLQAYGEVEKSLSSHPPRLIVITSNLGDFPQLASLLSQDYLFIEQIENARVWLKIKQDKK